MRDGQKALGRAMRAAVFSLVYSCTPQVPTNSVPPRLPPPMVSSWERGSCIYSDSYLEYRDRPGNQRGAISLDAPPREPRRLLCSSDFTVIIERTQAVVALGGQSVVGGREMLGMVSQRFVAANSYSINLRPIIEEDGGVGRARIDNDLLRISSRSGRTWEISLADPFAGWNIY